MNKIRRREISLIICQLDNLLELLYSEGINEVILKLDNIKNNIQIVLDDEEYYFNNIPENLQNGSRYDASEDAINNLEDSIEYLDNINNGCCLEEIQEYINNAIKYLNYCI